MVLQKIDLLFSENPNPMWVYDPNTFDILEVNQAALSMYGYDRDEMLSLTIKDLRPKSQVKKLIDEVNRKTRAFNNSGIWHHQKKNGDPLYVSILSHPIHWGEKKCKLVVAQDVTGQKEAENKVKELSKSDKNKQQKISTINKRLNILSYIGELFGEIDDFDVALQGLAEIVVNDVADICTIKLKEEKKFRQVALVHYDPKKQYLAEQFQAQSNDNSQEHPIVLQALQSGKSLFIDLREPKTMKSMSLDKEQQSVIKQFDLKAALIIPLMFKKEPLGFINLLWADRTPAISDDDLEVFEELGAKTALSVKNALMYKELSQLNENLDQKVKERTAELARKDMYIERMLDPIWVLNQENHTIDINPAFTRLLGYTRNEVMGRSIFEFVDEENQNILAKKLKKRSKEKSSSYEVTIQAKNGTGIPVLLSSSSIKENGKIVGKIGVLKDIRELKTMENALRKRTLQLETAYQELESFSYSVSHDLRAPLRAIAGYSNLLSEDHKESLDEEGNEFVTIIHEETNRMGELIDDLLAFSRMSRKEKQEQVFSMNELVQGVIHDIEMHNEGANPEFEIGELPEVQADPKLIQQVWFNLLSNAVKYRKQGQQPKVFVSVSRDENQQLHIFSVRDNGVGFDMKYADKLFGVFQRLHSDEEFEGTGIGLALAQRIVTRHEGQIWAESEPGKGSTFHFSLPIKINSNN